jgi:hypothetical protein
MSLKRGWGARRRARFQEEPPEESMPAERDAALDALDPLYEPDRLNPLWPPPEDWRDRPL